MKIKVGDSEFEATFNAFTPIAFSRCFNVVNPNGTTRPKDINEDTGAILENLDKFGFPPIVPLLEIFYACIKTADPKFDEKFDDWVSSFPVDEFDLERRDGWATDVMQIVMDNFFPRAKKDAVGAAQAEKAASAASE